VYFFVYVYDNITVPFLLGIEHRQMLFSAWQRSPSPLVIPQSFSRQEHDGMTTENNLVRTRIQARQRSEASGPRVANLFPDQTWVQEMDVGSRRTLERTRPMYRRPPTSEDTNKGRYGRVLVLVLGSSPSVTAIPFYWSGTCFRRNT
jgi:hypothetical protein